LQYCQEKGLYGIIKKAQGQWSATKTMTITTWPDEKKKNKERKPKNFNPGDQGRGEQEKGTERAAQTLSFLHPSYCPTEWFGDLTPWFIATPAILDT